jgi:hypothetical protein
LFYFCFDCSRAARKEDRAVAQDQTTTRGGGEGVEEVGRGVQENQQFNPLKHSLVFFLRFTVREPTNRAITLKKEIRRWIGC